MQDAYDWYESKQAGLGDKFLDDLEDCKNSICSFPLKHRIVKKQIRLVLMNRFPYLVYFEILDDIIHIIAIVYGGRHPDYWERK
ncbi:MAG: type II toxin-antitoxin system RelE/ParE family toxin [Bacteroidia bacterium]